MMSTRVITLVKFIKRESWKITAKSWGKTENKELFSGHSFTDGKHSGDWLHNSVNVLNNSEMHI